MLARALAAYRLAKADVFGQVNTDATARNLTALQCLSLSIREGDSKIFKPISLSAGIVLTKGEGSDAVLEAILGAIIEGREMLIDLSKVMAEHFPHYNHDIPPPRELSLGKLRGGYCMTDTCSAAHHLNESICKEAENIAQEFLEEDERLGINRTDHEGNDLPQTVVAYKGLCWHHLRCVWMDNCTKSISAYLSEKLRPYMDNIAKDKRVTTSIDGILRAADRYFGLTFQYVKGCGQEFLDWMEKKYPDVLLVALIR